MVEESHGLMDALGSAAARAITDVLRSSLTSFLNRPRSEPGPGPPRKPANRFMSRAPVPLPPPAAVPPPPAAAAPAAPAVAPVESSKSNLELPGLSFVGHIEDRPRAEGSTKFPTEFLSDHMEDRPDRLDLNKADGQPRMKALRGPLIDRSGREIIQ